VGIPTFFVQKGTLNHLMARILGKTAGVRPSHRYPGYLRVQNHEYRKALLKLLREDAADLIEQMGMQGTIDDLQRRLDDFEHQSVAGRLTRGIMAGTKTKTPLKMPARDFNLLAEQYYRETLRRQQMEEAVGLLAETAGQLDREQAELDNETRRAFRSLLQGQSAAELLERVKTDLLADRADLSTLRRLANLILVTVHAEQRETGRQATSGRSECNAAAPVYRAG